MRIKRFNAPDMRTALRMVREEQGPDAVILSSRQASDGVEVVAATDYDEAVVQQALRTIGAPEAPRTPAAPAAPAVPAPTAPAAAASTSPAPEDFAAVLRARLPERAQGRAVFHVDGEPVPARTQQRVAPASERPASRLEQVMAVLKGPRETPAPLAVEPRPAPATALPAQAPAAAMKSAPAPLTSGDPSTDAAPTAAESPRPAPAASPALRGVDPDPAMAAMRAELAAMRKIIERELGQLAGERLRGSPARAAALDALAAFGCDDPLAQQIAAAIDPSLVPETIAAPLRAALAAHLPVLPDEALDAGGILAVLGPTGAGKTTTIAKLAARYAARHRVRDVALVSTDNARAGAREQLHVLGRRLGITVCDAEGPDALARVLEQLADYPLVLIDTAGHGLRDRALLRQILWVRAASNVRSLLVLPANAHPADLDELLRRYRPAAPEGAILTKLDETTRPGAALSVLAHHRLPLAYTTAGQCVPDDIALADATCLADALEFPRRAPAATPHHDDGHHALA
ncbi:MAG: flagellar biosynthesis protein FlhF [Thermomonas haemolytica]